MRHNSTHPLRSGRLRVAVIVVITGVVIVVLVRTAHGRAERRNLAGMMHQTFLHPQVICNRYASQAFLAQVGGRRRCDHIIGGRLGYPFGDPDPGDHIDQALKIVVSIDGDRATAVVEGDPPYSRGGPFASERFVKLGGAWKLNRVTSIGRAIGPQTEPDVVLHDNG